jgi:hypothetical protein
MSDVEDTPEARLLARKGSAQYRADVEALIHERDTLEAEVARLRPLAAASVGRDDVQRREFGSIRTGVLEE